MTSPITRTICHLRRQLPQPDENRLFFLAIFHDLTCLVFNRVLQGKMACADETLTAAAAILQNLAREAPSSGSPSFDFTFSPHSTNGVDSLPKLPGEPSLAKVRFENELEGLVRRIHRMEVQTVSQPILSKTFVVFHTPFARNKISRSVNPRQSLDVMTSNVSIHFSIKPTHKPSKTLNPHNTLTNGENLPRMRNPRSSRKAMLREAMKRRMAEQQP